MLDELAPLLAPQRVRDLETRLHLRNEQTVPAEWEIAVGFALSKVGKIVDPGEHRAGNPDYIFTPADSSKEILIEVTTLSDQNANDENPVDLFVERMHAAIRKAGIDHKTGAFSWSLGDIEQDGKIIIGVPEKCHIDGFFKSPEFLAFLNDIQEKPGVPHRFDFQARGSNSVIAFTPGQNRCTSGGSHRSYKVARNIEDSTVFNSLRKKERQLKKADINLPAVVFLCDNDNHLLRYDQLNALGCYNIDQIVAIFLNGRQHHQIGPWIIQQEIPKKGKRINAIATLTVHHHHSMAGFTGARRELRGKFLPADHCDDFIKSDEFLRTINAAINHLPTPVSTPNNAMRKYKWPAFFGGGKMTLDQNSLSVSLSLLSLQRLLSGDISYDDFYRDHKDLIDQMRRVTANGQMISSIEVEAQKDQDDDWVTMKFDAFHPEYLFKVNKAS